MSESGIRNKHKCSFCIKLAKSLPVLLVWSLIGYSYYGYIYQLCVLTINSAVERILYVFVYHVTLFLLLWSYWQTVFTSVALVPTKFQLPDEIADQFKMAANEEGKFQAIEKHGNTLPIITRTFIGGRRTFRFCILCGHIKPDRAHHCRICGICVLKMDHHCPWVNNCISYANYKYFVLFLFYALIYCSFIAITTFPYFLDTWQDHFSNDGRIHILFVFVIAIMFCLCLMSIFSYHLYLTSYNKTTLEAFRAPLFENGRIDKRGFDIGLLNNFKQVFGNKIILWPIPLFTSFGDGVTFESKCIIPDCESLLYPKNDSWSSDEDECHPRNISCNANDTFLV